MNNDDIALSGQSTALISRKLKGMGIDFPESLVCQWAAECQMAEEGLDNVCSLLDRIKGLIDTRRAAMLKGMSRIPQTARKTFDNFSTSRLTSDNTKMINHLMTLAFIPGGENVVIVGDQGTGKTHIAQAVGNLCCDRLINVRYYKMSELAAKLEKDIAAKRIASSLSSLVSVPCLIIDEIGFGGMLSSEAADAFFQLMDRRYDKARCSTIFTSNKMPSEWKAMFCDEMLAKCVLDRIMDRCIAIEMRGSSYRGGNRTVYKVGCAKEPTISGIS